jgi:hypothetical protein
VFVFCVVFVFVVMRAAVAAEPAAAAAAAASSEAAAPAKKSTIVTRAHGSEPRKRPRFDRRLADSAHPRVAAADGRKYVLAAAQRICATHYLARAIWRVNKTIEKLL